MDINDLFDDGIKSSIEMKLMVKSGLQSHRRLIVVTKHLACVLMLASEPIRNLSLYIQFQAIVCERRRFQYNRKRCSLLHLFKQALPLSIKSEDSEISGSGSQLLW